MSCGFAANRGLAKTSREFLDMLYVCGTLQGSAQEEGTNPEGAGAARRIIRAASRH